ASLLFRRRIRRIRIRTVPLPCRICPEDKCQCILAEGAGSSGIETVDGYGCATVLFNAAPLRSASRNRNEIANADETGEDYWCILQEAFRCAASPMDWRL